MKKTNMKKCYIAGKIGDLSKETYESNFNKAKEVVVNLGYEAISPLDIHTDCAHEYNWLAFIRCDLTALLQCDAIYAQNNWITSPGAQIEVNLAHELGLTVIYENPMQSHYLKSKGRKKQNVEDLQEIDILNIANHGISNNQI